MLGGITISATVGAALKKIAVMILTNKKVMKKVLIVVVSLIMALLLPVIAVISVLQGNVNIDYNKKYCHNSPTLEEDVLQKAIMEAVKRVALRNCNLLKTLKTHIASNLKCEMDEDRRLDIKVRLAEIESEFKNILSMLSTDMDSNAFAEKKITNLMVEKRELELELAHLSGECPQSPSESKLNEISRVTDHLQNQPLMYDETSIRQILACVVVLSKEIIRVVFKDGTEIDQSLSQEQIEE